MSKSSNVRVIDVQTQQVLMTCSMEESNRAYAYAAELESMGLDVKVVTPTLSETLGNSLGLSAEKMAQYQESMAEEMEHHEGSCCFEKDAEDKKLN